MLVMELELVVVIVHLRREEPDIALANIVHKRLAVLLNGLVLSAEALPKMSQFVIPVRGRCH